MLRRGSRNIRTARRCYRAALLDAMPISSADPSYALEAEASHLEKLGELLGSAHAAAERTAFLASPRDAPTAVSLPISRKLAAIKRRLAEHQLRHAALNAKVAAASPDEGPRYPAVEGRDEAAIAAYVVPPVHTTPSAHLEHEGRALLYTSSALALAGTGVDRARALVSMAEVQLAAAAAGGWGADLWSAPAPEPEEGGEGGEGGDAAPPAEGGDEAAAEPAAAPWVELGGLEREGHNAVGGR